jgi:predicted nucleic acid-binding protein
MKAFLDTSVLVAVFYGDHVHHQPSLALFTSLQKANVCCGAHSLAELYSTVTRMPGKYRVGGEHAVLFIKNVQERLTIVSLDPSEYVACIEQAAASGISGGALYDALLARCAAKAKAQTVFTWNVRHYQQLGATLKLRIRTPGER